MADKTIGDLPAAAAIYDDDLFLLEQSGEAKNLRGALYKAYLQGFVNAASAASEEAAAALAGVRDAINNIPDGAATPIVNDLTTGGASMALSAEMGKKLKSELDGLTPKDIGAVASTAIDISDTDLLDTLKTGKSGFYRGVNVTNAPSTNWWYFEIVGNITGTYATIIAMNLGDASDVRVARWESSNTAISTWQKLATTDYAVPLDGSKPMTGALSVNGGQGVVKAGGGSAQLEHYPTAGNTATNLVFGIRAKDTLEKLARLYHTVDGVTKAYNILHTANKPSGSYTGNGSATSRTIDTGGIGHALMIYSANGSALVLPSGAFIIAEGVVTGMVWSGAHFQNGILTLGTTNAALNATGANCVYQVL